MSLPTELRLNGYLGEPDPGSAVHQGVKRWVGRNIDARQGHLKPGPLADRSDWRHPSVGWGLVLPENPALPEAERWTASDAPEPIRRLVESRGGAPVLRYADDLPAGKIRRYYSDKPANEPDLVASDRGIGYGEIPRYLLIYAPPTKIPWSYQYLLGAVGYAGRLDLEGQALDNYVTALIDEWRDATARTERAVVWAVDHGEGDITHLMRRVVAYKVHKALAGDPDIGAGATFLDGKADTATGDDLVAALHQSSPGLVVTTSHGMTGPLDNVAKMASQLGVPVDGLHALLDIDDLLARWSPGGAIWYAHACCSAGSDGRTAYAGLVADDTYAASVLKGVAQVGALVSPLPRALLGSETPLRAFIGHVEPTFDWTLRDQQTGQIRTGALVEGLYERLYQPMPIGRALEECHSQGPQLDMVHKQVKRDYNDRGEDHLEEALTCRLIAQDLESLVVLGDPTVALPSL